MKRVSLAVVCITLFIAAAASADDFVKPIRYAWIVTSCTTWDCAASEFMLSNGSPDVIVLPTGRQDRPFIVLKRIEEGSIFIPDDEPFTCNVFANVNEASLAFFRMDGCHAPTILNVPDGRAVITSLAKCGNSTTQPAKRRAVH